MFKRNFLVKMLSVLAIVSITSFVGVGTSYAAGDEVAPSEEGASVETLKTLCTESGGSWNEVNDTCKCPADKRFVVNGKCSSSNETQEACETNDDPNGIGVWDSEENICRCQGVFILNPETGKCYKPNDEQMAEACTSSGGTWERECQCPDNASVVSGFCRCNSGYQITGGTSLADEGASCVSRESGGGNEVSGDDPVGAVTGIKIATKSFNDARFSYVRRDLDNTIATIRDVVSNAITNTTNIAALQSGKQTRPDDNHACADGKTCLLVTDTSGTRNWYEIIDCVADGGLMDVGTPQSYPSVGTDALCTSSNSSVGCNTANNEYIGAWSNAIMFGVSRAVDIAQTAGSIVSLPSGIPSGDVCVCNLTGYRERNGDVLETRVNVTTDKWLVAGVSAGSACASVCMRAFVGGFAAGQPGAKAYFNSIGNSCSADATVATQAVQCNAALHQHRDAASNTCVCDTGYYDNNGTCEWDCRDKDNSHASGESCVCDDGYTEQNGSCVAQAPQQTCNSALETACNNSTNAGDWWNESTCTCDCANGRPGSVLGSNGQCVCPSGTEYNSTNGSCQAAPQCDVNTNLTEPGNIIENGEAWINEYGTGPNGLWGGKACDGRVDGILDASNAGTYDADYSCHADEWVHAHDNVAVYGEAKMVAINNDTSGAIVSLPSGVQEVNAGGVCVCRVTALAPTSGGSGFDTTYSSRESIDVGNTWMIAGRRENYGSNETGKQACITDCAFYTNSPNLITYYDRVGNSCSTTNVTNVTACTPHTTTADPYVSYVSNAGSVIRADSLGISALSKEGKGTGLCATDTTSAFCQQATDSLNHWVLKYTINDTKKYITANSDAASNIYNGSWVMYGDSRCVAAEGLLASLQEGKAQRVRLEKSLTTNNARGVVCIRNIAGYAPWNENKPGTITTIDSDNYWYATRYKDTTTCQAACNGVEGDKPLTTTELMNDVTGLTEAVNGMCGSLD